MKKTIGVFILLMIVGIYAQTGSISGTVIEEPDGISVMGARVHAVYDSASVIFDEGEAFTDNFGEYKIEDLDSGEYTVTVEKSDYYNVTYPERVDLNQGKNVAGVNFRLIPLNSDSVGISGEVRLLDYYGEYWQGKVKIYSYKGYVLGEAVLTPLTDSAGMPQGVAEYQITGLPLTQCYVVAEASGYLPQYYGHAYTVEEANKVYPSYPLKSGIEFDLERAPDSTLSGGVSGRISGRAGHLPYATVYAKKSSQLITGCINLESGKYWLALEPGVYTIYATRAGYKTEEYYSSVTVADQEVPDINISLDTASGQVILEENADKNYSISIIPNPFGQLTIVKYNLPEAEKISVKLYDASGVLVRTLQDGFQSPGAYELAWDGKNSRNLQLSAGVYFCHVSSDHILFSRPIVLMR